ncbi:hypothetical protein DKX38_011736 [Salix brachista]|uniref:Uncharacterized protein n=1 Tax=Salix brachista TaxID=2182728 RepID=A0A5N5LZT5_9ROSI|nr:hypothetical protein DKX38_023770 [Salix brachista]KAB5548330.1 hypothetical protein DKX38_011736 [Salix brachista]
MSSDLFVYYILGSVGVTMEEAVDWQMEILAQCMEECQPLFYAGREAGLLIGKNEKEEEGGQEWPFL